MSLQHPLFVSPKHHAPAVRVADCVISFIDVTFGERDRATFQFDFDDGTDYVDEGMQSGADGFKSDLETFSTLLAFLSCCGEAYRHYGDDGREDSGYSLFPPDIAEWAGDHLDELDALACELQELREMPLS